MEFETLRPWIEIVIALPLAYWLNLRGFKNLPSYFLISIVGFDFLTLLAHALFQNNWILALVHAVNVFILAFPRAMVAAKLKASAAVGSSSQDWPIEILKRADTLLFHEPDLFSKGVAELYAVKSLDPKLSDLALLQRVASLNRESEHPLMQAVLRATKAKRLELLEVENFKQSEDGTAGSMMGRKMAVGSADFLRQEGIAPGPLESLANELTREGHWVVLVGGEGRIIGLVSVRRPADEDNEKYLNDLKAQGFSLETLSAQDLESKMKILADLHSKKRVVIRLGEPHPELKADLTLRPSRLKELRDMIQNARSSHQTERRHLAGALTLNIGAVLLAALVQMSPLIAMLISLPQYFLFRTEDAADARR